GKHPLQNPRSLIGRALPLLIPRYRCRLNLQTAFLIARRLQARGGRSKIPEPSFPTTPQSRNPSAIMKTNRGTKNAV
ncbi:hypothetical protein ACSTY2_002083, partial [Neisseria gonorrhoeae]